ncbi:MAG: hypothetical protein ABSE15_06825 [Candidatus Bathyarchaeia archaeon]
MIQNFKSRKNFLANRKAYSGIIATIFMVLIALFLFFNVFMFVLDRNTAFQDSASQANQLLANRVAEKFTLSTPTYSINDATHQVSVSVNVMNVSPLSVLIESMWIKDSAAANPNCLNAPESIALQPGQSAILTGAVTIQSASSLDIGSCTSWFVTARGNTISTIQSESTIGSGSGNGACAAIIFGISGANTTSPFDLSKPLGGTGGSAAFAQLATGITTSNANDFIIASLGVQNGFSRGTLTNTIGVNNAPPAYSMIGAQVDASYSRCTADAYYVASSVNYYTDPSLAWNSGCKGTWGLILDAVKKSSSGGNIGFDNSFSTSVTTGSTLTLTLTTHVANDVLYLSWVGNSGETITAISTGGSSPSTSTWTIRAQVSADNGSPHYLETWYATSTTAGTYTIILTLSNSGS